MKKRHISIIFILALALIFIMCGCDKGEQTQTVSTALKTIVNFENWDELSIVACSDDFGKATINKDKKFIKSGNGSAKVEIYSKDKTSSMLIYPGLQPINISDFSGIDILTLDIYNAQDRPINFYMSLDARATSGMEIDGAVQTFVLNPNWNKVVFNVNNSTAGKVLNLKDVIHIAFRFDTVKQGYDSYTLYLDDLSIRHKENNSPPILRQDKEIMFFEDDRDLGLWNCSSYYFARYLYPITSLNYDKQFVSQGNSSMKAFIPKSEVMVFPMLELFTKATGVDFVGAKSISIDIYNANNKILPIDIHIRDFCRTSGAAPKADLKQQVWIQPNSWQTIKFTKEELTKATVNIEAIEQIAFETIDQNDPLLGDGITYYFDNFKVNK